MKVPNELGVQIVDKGNNGLVPVLDNDKIILQLRHDGDLYRNRVVHETCNEAEQSFVLALTKLMSAGITAGMSPSLVERVAKRVMDIVEVFEVPWQNEDTIPICFKSKRTPVYDYVRLEMESCQLVSGTVGEIAGVTQVSHETADELRREAEESGC